MKSTIFLLGIVVFGLIIFHTVLGGDGWLFTTDDGPGALSVEKNLLSDGYAGGWDTMVYAGQPALLKLSLSRWLLDLLPLKVFVNWIRMIDLVLASLLFGFFLRLKRRSWGAVVLGVITACWVGSTFTLIHAGHLGKFGVVLFAALSLWLIELAVQRRRWTYSALAGGALGGMFLEQQDLALFFLIMIGAYTVFAYVRAADKKYAWLARHWMVMGVIFILISFRSIWGGYHEVTEGSSFTGVKTAEEKWDHATQWSWPPGETLEFLVPGYLGWRSGDPIEPYRGRLGRTRGWDTHHRGIINFRLECEYIGYLPVVFALLAVATLFLKKQKRDSASSERTDKLFWAIVSMVLLLLSFGKFFPLYRLFYSLPFMGSIRNPVKFLQVFQFSLGILAAYGVDDLRNRVCARLNDEDVEEGSIEPKRPRDASSPSKTRNGVFYIVIWAWIVFDLLAIAVLFSLGDDPQQYVSKGWSVAQAAAIVENKTNGLLHAALLALIFVGVLHVFYRMRGRIKDRTSSLIVWALILVAAADAVWLSRRYVKIVPDSWLESNAVIDFLKQETPNQRVMIMGTDVFYKEWQTYHLPFHGIEVFDNSYNFLSEDYQLLKRAANSSGRFDRFGQLSAVKSVLGPVAFYEHLQDTPALRDQFVPGFKYNVVKRPEGGMHVRPATPEEPGTHVVLHARYPTPRYALIAGWMAVDDETALHMLGEKMYAPFETVLIAEEYGDGIPEMAGHGMIGEVEVLKRQAGRASLRMHTPQPAVLRIADKYDENWRAELDGSPVEVLRCDFLYQGIVVPEGTHDIDLFYDGGDWMLWIQYVGMAACAVVLGYLVVNNIRQSRR